MVPVARSAPPPRSSTSRPIAITLADVDHVVDADPFVGLVGQVEDARAVGDAVVQVADAGDVLLVVGAGRDDVVRLAAEHLAGCLAPPPATTGASRSVIIGSTSMRSRIS